MLGGMIYDHVERLRLYAGLSPAFGDAVDWLEQVVLAALPDGRSAIDGDRVFAIAASYDTWLAESFMLESHRRYHDIQLLVEGVERVRVLPPGVMPAVRTPYDDTKDATFYDPSEAGLDAHSRGVDLVLRPGWFVVFTPTDVHGPNRALGEGPSRVRKVVVKVAVD